MRKMLRQANVLEAGAYDATKGEITLTVIRPGFNKSRQRFYPVETLKRDFRVFEGSKMFIDHATDSQERARPEGSVRDWAATFKSLWVEQDGRVRAIAAVIDPEFKKKLENLAQHEKLGEMGISIRAAGEVRDATIEGYPTQFVERLIHGRSVDFVTYPSAGGGVEVLESIGTNDELDLDVVSLAQLRERRPDLVELIEADGGIAMNEVEKKLREEIEKGKAEIKRLTEAADGNEVKKLQAELKTKTDLLAEAEKVKSKAEAEKVLAKFLKESKLPEKAQERIRRQFAEAETDEGMEEAVKDMVKFVAEMAPDRVTDLGGDGEPESEKKVDLVKSFRGTGLSEAEAKIAAGVEA